MRQFRLSLTLFLLASLLLAQQGAVLHELSHLYYSGQSSGAQIAPGGDFLDNSHCLTCQAFAQVAHPATGSTPAFIAPAHAPPAGPTPLHSVADAAAPTPRNRGPPHSAV